MYLDDEGKLRPSRALTLRMLDQAGYNAKENPAIAALAELAAEPSGLDPAVYYDPEDYKYAARDWDGRKAYRLAQREVSNDLKRFRNALNIAANEGVTDTDVLAEAPHAYSGRLQYKASKAKHKRQTDPAKFGGTHKGGTVWSEVEVWQWEYSAGQYGPLEYRTAAAVLLEYATNRVRRSRPSEAQEHITTIAQLRALAQRNGSHWFDRGTMRFFRTKIESGVIKGHYFITSEQSDDDRPRNFTIRSFDKEANIDTIGDFNKHRTKGDALEALRAHLKAEKASANV